MRIIFIIAVGLVFMRCNEPHPPHAVYIDDLNLWVDETEVTIEEFKNYKAYFDVRLKTDTLNSAFIFSSEKNTFEIDSLANFLKPNRQKADSLEPATQITWGEACRYCNAANGRLATKEEWEFFSKREFHPGNIWEGYFPFKDEGLDGFKIMAAPVKSFEKNEFGLFDIYGNAREWVLSEDSAGGAFVKGGSFLTDYNSGAFLPDFELTLDTGITKCDIGFRCVYEW